MYIIVNENDKTNSSHDQPYTFSNNLHKLADAYIDVLTKKINFCVSSTSSSLTNGYDLKMSCVFVFAHFNQPEL